MNDKARERARELHSLLDMYVTSCEKGQRCSGCERIIEALLEFRKEALKEVTKKANEIADSYGAVISGESQSTSNRRDDYAAEHALRNFARELEE